MRKVRRKSEKIEWGKMQKERKRSVKRNGEEKHAVRLIKREALFKTSHKSWSNRGTHSDEWFSRSLSYFRIYDHRRRIHVLFFFVPCLLNLLRSFIYRMLSRRHVFTFSSYFSTIKICSFFHNFTRRMEKSRERKIETIFLFDYTIKS